MPLLRKLEVVTVIILLASIEQITFFTPIVLNIISTIFYVFLFIIIFRRGKKYFYVATQDISLLVLVGLAIGSYFWSADMPNTAYQIRFLLRTSLLGVYLAMQYTPREQMSLLSWATGIRVILSYVTCFLLPSYCIGTDSAGNALWTGIAGHKQNLGRQIAFTASLFLSSYFAKVNNKLANIIFLILSLYLLIASRSKTGLVVFTFSLFLLGLNKFFQQKEQKYKPFIFFILVVIFSIVTTYVAINYEFIVVDLLGKDVELNGRLPLWEASITKGLEQPWLGYGYLGFWTSDVSDYVYDNSWSASKDEETRRAGAFHAHNGLIELFLELGCVGVVIFIINYFFLIIRIINLLPYFQNKEHFWMLQFLGIFFVANISEGNIILSGGNLLWLVYVSTALSSALDNKQMKSELYLKASPEALNSK
ncbi:O-antigen ligase family protein [Nostoc sp. CENA67]|uniref:O-antigen ligase family protein n=1 Tax=Amazonocrinis nigriterrae CENA67 TaxID=2794033 RepID=A0A8J7LC09_9NOST|nr:O-antigen ligase family protein [Amazonocrinis nigriterrae]MBH8566260.1 O-antigen ligase family protein [Amazonocrinis nigriterrae CENA67]